MPWLCHTAICKPPDPSCRFSVLSCLHPTPPHPQQLGTSAPSKACPPVPPKPPLPTCFSGPTCPYCLWRLPPPTSAWAPPAPHSRSPCLRHARLQICSPCSTAHPRGHLHQPTTARALLETFLSQPAERPLHPLLSAQTWPTPDLTTQVTEKTEPLEGSSSAPAFCASSELQPCCLPTVLERGQAPLCCRDTAPGALSLCCPLSILQLL